MSTAERARHDSTADRARHDSAAERARDDEDAAAVLAVLAAITGQSEPEPAAVPSIWADPVAGPRLRSAAVRPADGWPAGPGRWWASGLPGMTPALSLITTVLASASPARLAVLRAAGVDPVVRVSGIDEKQVESRFADFGPDTVVGALARAKVDAVLPQLLMEYPDAVVIGCDSMLLFDNRLVGKPSDVGDARRQWEQMAGRSGDLLTGHAVLRIRNGVLQGRSSGVERTVIRFGSPTAHEVSSYLATGEPLEVAGSLTIDGYGGWFVDGVDGDPSSVIGISLPLTRRLLAELGVSVVDLWRRPPVTAPS